MNSSIELAQAVSDFHFLRPLWLLALIPALFFFTRLWRLDAQGSAWHKVIDQSLLPYLLNVGKTGSQRLPLVLLIIVWILTSLALAGPTWSKQTQPVQQRQDALVIVLDLSLGMFATDRDPNRITVARRKILDILDMRREGQTGLVVYAGEAHMVTPLTSDSVTIRAMVPALNPNIMPVVGNNPAHALAMAAQLLDDAAAINGRILLMTAGVPSDQGSAIISLLNQSPYPLHIVGIGTPRGSAIPTVGGEVLRDSNGQIVVSAMDREFLQSIAANLRGRYHDITINASDLEHVLAESLLRGADGDYLESEEEVELWYDMGPWLLLLLLPLCALCFRRGWVLQVAVAGGAMLLVMTPETAQAQSFDIRSLWLNKDQRAARAMENDDPGTAAILFQNSAWRGTANYRAGDYEAAIREFSQSEDIDSLYNLGNALAFAERLQEALNAYEAVLAQQPDHADALHNKAIIEDLIEQQEQEQQEQQQQEQEEQENQDSQSEADSDDSEQQEQQENQQQQQDQQQDAQDQPPNDQEQESDSDSTENQNRSNADVELEEDQESLEQFLRRIEDDPGELLQRKFQFESRRRMIERRTAGQNTQ
jgi:Ca-activated chloride channel homolog